MPRRKRKDYAVAIDESGRASAEGSRPREFGDEWTPEHLLLAALAKCSLTSLAYHARRDSLTVQATAGATGGVFERTDGRWGFVDVRCVVEATVEPALDGARLSDLLARAERGCFVGASLDPPPEYEWRVNGVEVG